MFYGIVWLLLMNAAFQNVPFGRFKNGAIPWLLQEDYYE